MEAWQKDFWQLMEVITDGADKFFSEVTEAVEGIAIEIDQIMVDAVEPMLEAYLGFETSIEEAAQPFVQTMQPILEEHPACVGCRHFHGQAYGGNHLVCAMHPYGSDSEVCSDWQSTWEDLP